MPFGHSGYSPGGTAIELEYVNSYPAYFEADQLYNLKEDPLERNNLANDKVYEEELIAMKKRLKAQLDDLPGGFGEFKEGE